MRVYLALVALSAGASATPSVVKASTAAGVAETHAERELLTRSEAKKPNPRIGELKAQSSTMALIGGVAAATASASAAQRSPRRG